MNNKNKNNQEVLPEFPSLPDLQKSPRLAIGSAMQTPININKVSSREISSSSESLVDLSLTPVWSHSDSPSPRFPRSNLNSNRVSYAVGKSKKTTGFDRGFDEIPVREVVAAAFKGDADAQFNLGTRLEEGNGVDCDPDLALKWYEKASSKNHAGAQNNMGAMHEERGLYERAKLDYEKAKNRLIKAADNFARIKIERPGWAKRAARKIKSVLGIKQNISERSVPVTHTENNPDSELIPMHDNPLYKAGVGQSSRSRTKNTVIHLASEHNASPTSVLIPATRILSPPRRISKEHS